MLSPLLPSPLCGGRCREATEGGISPSAAIAAEAFGKDQRLLHPGVREVVIGDLLHRLEQLEMVPRLAFPEHDRGLERRAAGKVADNLRDQDRRVGGELEALAGPLAHPL